MTSYAATPTGGTTTAGPSRPMTLVLAIGAAVVSAAGTIVAAVIILTGGRQLVVDLTAQIATDAGLSPDDLSLDDPSLAPLFDDATATLHTRGIVLLVLGVAMLVLGVLSLKAATWARVLITIAAAVTMIYALVTATDLASSGMEIGGFVGALGALLTIVLIWLGPNNRYRKALAQG